MRVVTIGDKTATHDILVFGKYPGWAKNLHVWGEAGVMKEGKDSKTGDRGELMMFVGYPLDQESDSVHMWNRDTNGIVTTCDVIWLKRLFFEPEPSIGVELDARMLTTDATNDTQVITQSNDDETNDSNWNRCIKFVDEVDDNDAGVTAAWEGKDLSNATVTCSGRVSKPPEQLIDVNEHGNEIHPTTVRR